MATKEIKTVSENDTPVVENPIEKELTTKEKIELYKTLTGLELDPNCHMDMEFLSLWYENKYLTKIVYRWAMNPGERIMHYGDGVVYRASNMTDEIAERLMKENPAYEHLFVDLAKE